MRPLANSLTLRVIDALVDLVQYAGLADQLYELVIGRESSQLFDQLLHCIHMVHRGQCAA